MIPEHNRYTVPKIIWTKKRNAKHVHVQYLILEINTQKRDVKMGRKKIASFQGNREERKEE